MKVVSFLALFLAVRHVLSTAASLPPPFNSYQDSELAAGTSIEREMAPGRAETFLLRLGRGESAQVDVLQIGVDVIVDLVGPDGRLLDSIDGPTGRTGVETVEVFATAEGPYTVKVRPYDDEEPTGRFRLTVRSVRDAATTRRLMAQRKAARKVAAQQLRRKSARFDTSPTDGRAVSTPVLRELVGNARVIGLGEATHGSREFNDARLALTKQLVRDFGCRVITLEFSASRARELEPYAAGKPVSAAVARSHAESGWIGSRIRGRLYAWVRSWNATHPAKDRVTVVGVDAGDNGVSRERLFAFLWRAYTAQEVARWSHAENELRDADAQTIVFGDSGIDEQTRVSLLEILVRLTADRPMLQTRFGERAIAEVIEDAFTLFEFADFNAGGGAGSRSRDWYMAMRVLRAIRSMGPKVRAVYWAHNAHVAVTGIVNRTTGRLLRDALGDKYRPIAATCGAGSFVAQMPNDLEDRLAVSSFLPHQGETLEDVLSLVRPGPFVAYWCGPNRTPISSHLLSEPLPMHWIGGLYTPSSPPSSQYRAFRLIRDFDAVVYLPKVTAEPLPPPRPVVPARRRN